MEFDLCTDLRLPPVMMPTLRPAVSDVKSSTTLLQYCKVHLYSGIRICILVIVVNLKSQPLLYSPQNIIIKHFVPPGKIDESMRLKRNLSPSRTNHCSSSRFSMWAIPRASKQWKSDIYVYI